MIRCKLRHAREFLADQLLGRAPAAVQPTDCFITSWPRSGNTWMRFLVGHAVCTHVSALDGPSLDQLIPVADRADLPRLLAQPAGQTPRFFKCHEPCIPYLTRGRVVHIIRDGRDAALSYYDYKRNTGKSRYHDLSFSQFLRLMLRGKVGYGSWHDNVGGWWSRRDHPAVLIIRYEDMLADTESQLRRVLRHFGLVVDDHAIRQAVHRSTVRTVYRAFDNHESHGPGEFRGGLGGGAGRWRDAFSDDDLALFMQHAGALLDELGYTAAPPAVANVA